MFVRDKSVIAGIYPRVGMVYVTAIQSVLGDGHDGVSGVLLPSVLV